jgi:hypothetical protein
MGCSFSIMASQVARRASKRDNGFEGGILVLIWTLVHCIQTIWCFIVKHMPLPLTCRLISPPKKTG